MKLFMLSQKWYHKLCFYEVIKCEISKTYNLICQIFSLTYKMRRKDLNAQTIYKVDKVNKCASAVVTRSRY